MFTGQAKAAIQALIDNEWPENPSPQNYIHDDCVDYAKSVLSAMLEGSDG